MSLQFKYDSSRRKGIIEGDDLDEIRDHFSILNQAAAFARARGKRFIPQRKYAITGTGRFDLGLFHEINRYCIEQELSTPLVSKELAEALNTSYPSEIKPTRELAFDARPYQQAAILSALKFGRGIIEVATAGGKSFIAASLISSIHAKYPNLKCAFVVPDRGLVNQMFNDFAEYKVPFSFSKWTGDDPLNLFTNVVICNMGIIQSKESNTKWMEGVDLFIVDETHKLRKGNKICKIVDKAKTMHRFGFTGTLPEDKLDQWNIKGLIGPVIFRKKAWELKEEQYVAPVKAQILELAYNDVPKYEKGKSPRWNYDRDIEFITHNEFRNRLICTLSRNFKKNALILVDFLEHGDTISKAIRKACPGKKVYWVHGAIDVDERDRIKRIMETNDNVVCVAISKIFSTGISIKNLHYLVFAGGGKSKIKTLQSIGRLMRLHESKRDVYIIDIADKTTYGERHLTKRLAFYKKEKITYASKTIKED